MFGLDLASGTKSTSPYVAALFEEGDLVSWLSVGLIAIVATGLIFIIATSKRYQNPS